MLKEAAGIKKSNISMSMFEKYFKAVNNPDDVYFSPDEDAIYFIERYENDEFKIISKVRMMIIITMTFLFYLKDYRRIVL
jgi:DNA-directed RNA polymerase subunit E'/Rpb7